MTETSPTDASSGKANFATPANVMSPELPHEILKRGNREVIKDFYFDRGVESDSHSYARKVFVRLNSRKELQFKKISFQHCVFEGCYFNTCTFDSCDFTGCRFVSCNFHHSKFPGCRFDYATFERTDIDDEILESDAPREENLRMRFARSLRMNYSQLGDARAVNKAIAIELQATADYLHKSWSSKETYYRQKYPGLLTKFGQFSKWVRFWLLDFIWGNGESIGKLSRTMILVVVLIALYDATCHGDPSKVESYWNGLQIAPAIFLGALTKPYPLLVLSGIAITRFIGIALLTAVLIKRFGRR